MTKAEIAKIVHERVGLSKKESGQIVDAVLDVIRNSLENNDDVKLSGFGHFMVRSKNARRGRNPKTGGEITISSRQIVTFRASQVLKKRLMEESE